MLHKQVRYTHPTYNHASCFNTLFDRLHVRPKPSGSTLKVLILPSSMTAENLQQRQQINIDLSCNISKGNMQRQYAQQVHQALTHFSPLAPLVTQHGGCVYLYTQGPRQLTVNIRQHVHLDQTDYQARLSGLTPHRTRHHTGQQTW